MKFRKWVSQLDLITVLVLVAFIELALNRLAVPILRPQGSQLPPEWHRELDRAGLFAFYLATLLALGVGALKTWELTITRRSFPLAARVLVETVGVVFFLLAAWTIVGGGQQLGFHLESCFTLLLLVLAMAAASQPGDARAKLGLLVLAVPFLLHYYGTFALRLLVDNDTAHSTGLPDRLREAGQWSVAIASMVAALCFAPRRRARSGTRLEALVIVGFAGLVGTLVAVIMMREQGVVMDLASKGLGIDLGPAPPAPVLVTFVVAATSVVWTLAKTLTSPIAARRMVGGGFALVVLGGYAFAWPLQLLTVVVGMLAVTDGAGRLPADEDSAGTTGLVAPPIPGPVWRAYLDALAAGLTARLSADGDDARVSGERAGVGFEIDLVRPAQSLRALQIDLGRQATPPVGPPVWTLFARAEGLLDAGLHPPPPPSSGRPLRTGDVAFDRRFRVADAGGLTARLLDDGLRARAAALLDGWVAVWPNGELRYQVFPGRGAPLDHPVPQSELALGGDDLAAATERLVNVLDLLVELHTRARGATT